MIEELGEVAKALRNGDRFAAATEAADLQLSAETFIADLDLDGQELRALAIEKNDARGYYETPEPSIERRLAELFAKKGAELGREIDQDVKEIIYRMNGQVATGFLNIKEREAGQNGQNAGNGNNTDRHNKNLQ